MEKNFSHDIITKCSLLNIITKWSLFSSSFLCSLSVYSEWPSDWGPWQKSIQGMVHKVMIVAWHANIGLGHPSARVFSHSWDVESLLTRPHDLSSICPRHILLTVFHHNSNLKKILFCSRPICGGVITTKFCTCHDNCAVMTCAKICSD